MKQTNSYIFKYLLVLFLMIQILSSGCNKNKYPECEGCQLDIKFGDQDFKYNTANAREGSSVEDRFSIFIGFEDEFGILREVLNVSNIIEREGVYPTTNIFNIMDLPENYSVGGFRTYLLDGDVGGKTYQPDSSFTNYIEIFDWNPEEGYVEGQIVGTYIQKENHIYDADTLEITTNIFKIKLEEIE